MINLFSIGSSTFRIAKYVFEYFISLRFSLASWTQRTLIHNLFFLFRNVALKLAIETKQIPTLSRDYWTEKKYTNRLTYTFLRDKHKWSSE